MTAFDPSLDQSQTPFINRLSDPRAVAFLRHDIDRALGVVLAGLNAVAATGLDERAREHLDQATIAGRTLTALFRVMRNEDVGADEVSVEWLMARTRAAHAADVRVRGLTLVTTVGEEVPPALRVDAVTLTRILDNLVDNALRFASSGTVTVEVGRDDEGGIVFRVADEGPGFGGRRARCGSGARRDDGTGARHRGRARRPAWRLGHPRQPSRGRGGGDPARAGRHSRNPAEP